MTDHDCLPVLCTCGLNTDEIRVLDWIAQRLRMGQKIYGELDIAGDRRDWKHERHCEEFDLLVYAACEDLKRGDK